MFQPDNHPQWLWFIFQGVFLNHQPGIGQEYWGCKANHFIFFWRGELYRTLGYTMAWINTIMCVWPKIIKRWLFGNKIHPLKIFEWKRVAFHCQGFLIAKEYVIWGRPKPVVYPQTVGGIQPNKWCRPRGDAQKKRCHSEIWRWEHGPFRDKF